MKRRRLYTSNALETPDSATTSKIDYSAKRRILEVEYSNGKIYHYHHVEPEIWDLYRKTVLSGGSSGQFVNYVIKPKYLEFERI